MLRQIVENRDLNWMRAATPSFLIELTSRQTLQALAPDSALIDFASIDVSRFQPTIIPTP